MECVKSEFEYFLHEPIVTQIERSFYREYTPISALQHQTPIEFVVPGTDQIYLDLFALIHLPEGEGDRCGWWGQRGKCGNRPHQ